uniref:Secreted protein n=1 Tax=Oryza brachyantha TaxID=4533 RepID=J3MAQ5_ORYBR
MGRRIGFLIFFSFPLPFQSLQLYNVFRRISLPFQKWINTWPLHPTILEMHLFKSIVERRLCLFRELNRNFSYPQR